MLKSAMSRAWNLMNDLEVQELRTNVFLFSFQKEGDKRKVLRGLPWSVSIKHIVIKKWPTDMALEDLELNKTSLWV